MYKYTVSRYSHTILFRILGKYMVTSPLDACIHLTILWKWVLSEKPYKSTAWFFSNTYSSSSEAVLIPHWGPSSPEWELSLEEWLWILSPFATLSFFPTKIVFVIIYFTGKLLYSYPICSLKVLTASSWYLTSSCISYFICCEKTPWPEVTWGGNGVFQHAICSPMLQQELTTGSWRWDLERPCGVTPITGFLAELLSYIFLDCLPEVSLISMDLELLHQSLIKNMLHKLTYRPVWL